MTKNSATKLLDKFFTHIMVFDWEENGWKCTIDGTTTTYYTKTEFLNLKPLDDNPGYDPFAETIHLAAQPEDHRGRNAQIYTAQELQTFYARLQERQIIFRGLAQKMTARVLAAFGMDKPESCLGWYKYLQSHTPIQLSGWIKEWRPLTAKDLRVHMLREETRKDACNIKDREASLKYPNDRPLIMLARTILSDAFYKQQLSDEMIEDLELTVKFQGKPKERLDFNKPRVIALLASAVTAEGKWRTDTKGNPLGIRTIHGDILQLHPRHMGKGSHAAPRATLRQRLKKEEQKFRKNNDIPEVDEGFNDPIPQVRQRHERVNKTVLKLIRNYLT